MNLIEQIHRIERLDQLIRLKATGSPAELAAKLAISNRQLFNLLSLLRNEFNAPVKYDNECNSYIYSEPGNININYRFNRKNEMNKY